jgi:hypothetical protein
MANNTIHHSHNLNVGTILLFVMISIILTSVAATAFLRPYSLVFVTAAYAKKSGHIIGSNKGVGSSNSNLQNQQSSPSSSNNKHNGITEPMPSQGQTGTSSTPQEVSSPPPPPPPPPPLPLCPGGSSPVGGKCPTGYSTSTPKQSFAPQLSSVLCPEGSVPDANGNCITETLRPPPPQPPTSQSSPVTPKQSFAPQLSSVLCPEGSVPDANGNSDGSKPQNGQCPITPCPAGSVRDPITKGCILRGSAFPGLGSKTPTTTCPDGSTPIPPGYCPRSATPSSPSSSSSSTPQQSFAPALCPDGSIPVPPGYCPRSASSSSSPPTPNTCPDGSKPDANGNCSGEVALSSSSSSPSSQKSASPSSNNAPNTTSASPPTTPYMAPRPPTLQLCPDGSRPIGGTCPSQKVGPSSHREPQSFAPALSSLLCPDNSMPDANGNCSTATPSLPSSSPPPDQGSTPITCPDGTPAIGGHCNYGERCQYVSYSSSSSPPAYVPYGLPRDASGLCPKVILPDDRSMSSGLCIIVPPYPWQTGYNDYYNYARAACPGGNNGPYYNAGFPCIVMLSHPDGKPALINCLNDGGPGTLPPDVNNSSTVIVYVCKYGHLDFPPYFLTYETLDPAQIGTIVKGQCQDPIAQGYVASGPSRLHTVNQGSIVTLDGSESFATAEGASIVSYSWIQTAGPSIVLTGATTVRPIFTAPQQSTTLLFSLTVKDSNGSVSGPATISVTVR